MNSNHWSNYKKDSMLCLPAESEHFHEIIHVPGDKETFKAKLHCSLLCEQAYRKRAHRKADQDSSERDHDAEGPGECNL